MKGEKARLVKSIVSSAVWLVVGIALSVGSFLLPTLNGEPYLKWIVLATGLLVIILSIICLAIFCGKISKVAKERATGEENGATISKPSKVVQTVEQKMAQIDLMDNTQFAVFVSRLYQNNGYVVRFEPVGNRRGITFVAERQGFSCAVVCLWTCENISATDLEDIFGDFSNYPYKTVMFVTNYYLDKSAKKFAKRKRISVIDRKELAKQLK